MALFRFIPKKFLGVDIGTSSIKVVEVSSWARRTKLENYGEISANVLYEKPFRTFEKSTLLLSGKDISKAIKAIIEEAGMKAKKAVFSIPDFSTFFTSFELPPMSKEELPQAVMAEARRHVPLPLAEVTLDWQVVNKKSAYANSEKIKILLVTVPNEVINQYTTVVSNLELGLLGPEPEVFSLMRALIDRDEKRVVSIIDIGARSTTCSIIDRGALKVSHSFDISGNNLTERISKALSIDYKEAEELKKKYDISSLSSDNEKKNNIREILTPLIDLIVVEIDKVFNGFRIKERKEVDKIIMAGGAALLPGLTEYFKDHFKKEIEVANPFSKLFFPPILDKTLEEMGPAYSIALGSALRGLE
jgi:type IV pilus assembly protein PilM